MSRYYELAMAAGAPVFKPEVRAAFGQKLAFGATGLLLAAGAHYLETRESIFKSAVIGLAVGIVLAAIVTVRDRNKSVSVLVVGEDNLTIEDDRSSTALPWGEITRAVHVHHGENRWEFHLAGRAEPVRFALQGLVPSQLQAIKAELLKRIRCEEERTPVEGPRPLPLPEPQRLAA